MTKEDLTTGSPVQRLGWGVRGAGAAVLVVAFITAVHASGASSAGAPPLHLFGMGMGLLGGLAIFLFGLSQMADALKLLAGDSMKFILARLTTNRFTGALTGAFVTAIIQSSSVTTVLLVGFISAGIISLSQAVGIIFGANIGSTFTAQLIAFKITEYSLLLVAVGFAMSFASKRDHIRQYGAMVMGLGMIFLGMGIMSDAMAPLRKYSPFLELMASMQSPFLGILIGALFTGMVQSSAATIGIVIAMSSQGLMGLAVGISIVFGANIGTCVTAVLAAIGKPREAVRASLVHVLFNIVGVAIWVFFIDNLADFVVSISPASPGLTGLERLAAETPRQLANAHTLFNVANTILFIPFTVQFARLAQWLIPEPARPVEQPAAEAAAQRLDDSLLLVPALALAQARQEIHRMGTLVRAMLVDIHAAMAARDGSRVAPLLEQDRQVDSLSDQVVRYLARIAHANLTASDSEEEVRLLHLATEVHHIGDVIEKNLVPLLERRARESIGFAAEALEEFNTYHRRVLAHYDEAILAVESGDAEMARAVVEARGQLAALQRAHKRAHYNRLRGPTPESPDSSQVHLDAMSYLRRISSHAESIAGSLLESPLGEEAGN